MELDELIEEYKKVTPTSQKMYEKAKDILPGGVSANIKFFAPYPVFMKHGKGAWLTDEDNNKYVDYLLSYGPLELGHGHPVIVETMREQMQVHGSMLYGTPHKLESEYAQRIKDLIPSVEMLRYTNSGTEATLFCLRLAYAYTHKYKIAKVEGHYHGGYNQVLVSVNPKLSEVGNLSEPNRIPESAGLEPYQMENTIVLPFNDLEDSERIIRKYKDELAAVIMEPIMAGYIPATKEYIQGLRKITEELGILLIIDEVKTGLRVSLGGAQEYYGVKPDLSAFGKVFGGGLPFGIVGGKKEILNMTAPKTGADIFDASAGKISRAEDVVFHSGTYNGHPLILNMAMSVLDVMTENFDNIKNTTDYLKEEIHKRLEKKGIPSVMIGLGTMFNIAITNQEDILSYRDMQKCDFELRKKLDFALLLNGIYNKPTNRYSLSIAHTPDVIDFTLEAYDKALKMI